MSQNLKELPALKIPAEPAPSVDLPAPQIKPEVAGGHPPWTARQRFVFRVAVVFIGLLILPLRWPWVEQALNIRTLREFYSWVMMRGGGVDFVTLQTESARWGVASFVNWGVALLIGLAVGLVWTWLARRSPRKEYRVAYYWFRLLVRYWVAFNIMNYGYMKLFPNQMPLPSLSNLGTLLGDHAPYRTYWQIVGLVTWYQVFLGFVEVAAGALLFLRRTAALGALVNFGVLLNVAHANFAYDGGVHVHSGLISLLSVFLLLHYLPDLWRLLIKGEDVRPDHYRPVFSRRWQRRVFAGVKLAAWFVFLPLYAYLRYDGHYHSGFSKEPRGAPLPGAKGYYQVTEFRLNGETLPYSPLDPVRWHEVVFEDYPTLVYKVNKALPVRLENGSPAGTDLEKRYELAGFAGGKRYFHYAFDEAKQELYLQDKSIGPARSGRRGRAPAETPPTPAVPKLTWKYERPSESRLVLSGLDENQDAIYVVLDRIDRDLPIEIHHPVPGEPLCYERKLERRHAVWMPPGPAEASERR